MDAVMNSRKHLYALAAGLCLVLIIGGWFLLIAPQRTAVNDLRAQVTQQESANEGLRSQVAALRALQAKLPQQQADLARIQSKVPDKPALPELLRMLNTAASDAGVTLTGVTPTAPAAIPGATGVSGIDVTVKVTGDYLAVEQYELALEGLSRAFLVNGISLDGGAATSTGSGTASTAPASASNALNVTFSGRVLVQSGTAAAATGTGSAGSTGSTASTASTKTTAS